MDVLSVLLELRPIKAVTAETPTNQDEANVSFTQEQCGIIPPMPSQLTASGVWAQRADYPGTPLEPRDDGNQGVIGGTSTPKSRRFSDPRESLSSPPVDASYRGPPLQGAWAKPLGSVAVKACCTPRGSVSFMSPAPATPPPTISPAPTVTAARRGVAPQGSLVRQGSHPPNVSIGGGGGAQASSGGAQDATRRQRQGSVQEPMQKVVRNYGPRRPSQPYDTKNEYQRSESDSHALAGPVGAGNQRKNTSEPPTNRPQVGSAKSHRIKR